MTDSRFTRAVAGFDAINAGDPVQELDQGIPRPRELVHAERLARCIERLNPDASEALRLAARCQHVGRYRIPRSSYPDGRSGYLRWRSELARLHADTASTVLGELGYEAETIDAVRNIVQKRGLSSNPDAQAMEDALCLVFLEYELEEFATRHDDQKLARILRKTWGKMSPSAREHALALPLAGRPRALLALALAPPTDPPPSIGGGAAKDDEGEV